MYVYGGCLFITVGVYTHASMSYTEVTTIMVF